MIGLIKHAQADVGDYSNGKVLAVLEKMKEKLGKV